MSHELTAHRSWAAGEARANFARYMSNILDILSNTLYYIFARRDIVDNFTGQGEKMERKIRIMDRTMRIAILLCLTPWAFFTRGIIWGLAVGAVLILTTISLLRQTDTLDERELQIRALSGYGAFITAICFIVLMMALENAKTSQITSAYGYALAVLVLSKLLFRVVFKGMR